VGVWVVRTGTFLFSYRGVNHAYPEGHYFDGGKDARRRRMRDAG
jgi:hypothetical protein